MTLEQLRALLAQLDTKMRGMLDDNPNGLDDDQKAAYDDLEKEFDETRAKIEDAEKREAKANERAAYMNANQRSPLVPGADNNFRIGKGVEDNRNMDETGFASFGDFVGAVAARDMGRLKEYDHRSQSSATGSEGGFLIPTTFQKEILQISFDQSIVRQRATVVPAGDMPDAAIDIPYLDQSNGLSGGLSFQWTNDDSERPDAGSIAMKMLNLQPQEVSGTWTVPNKTLRNVSALSSLMMQLFGRAYVEMENQVLLFDGNGVGKPLAALKAGSVIEVTRNTASKVDYNDTVRMLQKRIPGETGYIWLYTLDTEGQLIEMKDEAGQLIYKPTANAAVTSVLHGLPGIVNQYSPALGNTNDLALLDLSKYVIKDGAGMMIDVSEHAEFKNAKTVFRFINNLDAGPWVKDKIKLKNNLNTSPFITLK